MSQLLKKVILIALAALGTIPGMVLAEKTLVITSWGGSYKASQQKAYHDPYLQQNPDVKIIHDDSAAEGPAKLREQAKAGNVTWDLLDITAANAIALCNEGLVEEINPDQDLAPAPDGTPASQDFGDLMVSPCLAPQIVYSTTFGYRIDKVKTRPTTINDVFDLQKIPGKRALEKVPTGNLEWALLADGVPAEELYDVLITKEGVDRAFKKLDTIKDQVIWWTKGAEPAQLLADGEVVIASAYNGRLFNAIVVEKQPIGMMWDWQIFNVSGWVVPKGSKNKAAIMEYLRFATDTQRLADQAKYISYGPARISSTPLVGNHATLGIDMKPHMPNATANAKRVLLFNYELWPYIRADLDKRFQAWLAQ